MQFNIYVPNEKAGLISTLDRIASATGKSKNEIVLEALERYLPTVSRSLGKFDLGERPLPSRSEIYRERLEQ